jgi:hypothetical protein
MQRTKRLTIKMSSVEKAVLQKIAEGDNESVAVTVRRLIRQAAIAKGISVIALSRSETETAVYSGKKIA